MSTNGCKIATITESRVLTQNDIQLMQDVMVSLRWLVFINIGMRINEHKKVTLNDHNEHHVLKFCSG